MATLRLAISFRVHCDNKEDNERATNINLFRIRY